MTVMYCSYHFQIIFLFNYITFLSRFPNNSLQFVTKNVNYLMWFEIGIEGKDTMDQEEEDCSVWI